MKAWLKATWNKYKKVIILVLFVKTAIILLVLFGKGLIQPDWDFTTHNFIYTGEKASRFEKSFAPYDGQIYLRLSDDGYTQTKTSAFYAFYPFYPSLIRLISVILTVNFFASGIIITLLSSFVGAVYMYKLFLIDTDERSSFLGVLFFLFFPVAIIFSSIYNESLFLALSVMCIYYARNGKWWASGAAGFFAALTRPQGVLLFVPVVIEYIIYLFKNDLVIINRNFFNKIYKSLASILLIPLGQFLFFLYGYFTKHQLFVSLYAQSHWQRKPANPLNMIGLFYDRLSNPQNLRLFAINYSLTDLIFSLVFLLMIPYMFKKIRASYMAYSLLLLILPLSTGTTMSMTRFVSLSFPHFLYLGMIGSKNKIFSIILMIIFSILMTIFCLRFINWHWIG